MGGFGLKAPFNEPVNSDPTSAPPEQVPVSPIAQVLSQHQKKKKAIRLPGPLAGAIARAKRAKQSSHKYGV